MQTPRRSTRQTLRAAIQIIGALFVLVAQVGAVGAGVMHSRAGASAAAHFENDGTNLHYAHNEADCFMCRAQHPDDATPPVAEPAVAVGPAAEAADTPEVLAVAPDWHAAQQSRAPPAIV